MLSSQYTNSLSAAPSRLGPYNLASPLPYSLGPFNGRMPLNMPFMQNSFIRGNYPQPEMTAAPVLSHSTTTVTTSLASSNSSISIPQSDILARSRLGVENWPTVPVPPWLIQQPRYYNPAAVLPGPLLCYPPQQLLQGGPVQDWLSHRHRGNTRRHRTVFTQRQLQILESAYNRFQYLNCHLREQLMVATHLREECIEVWFKNRRSKQRKTERAREGQNCSYQEDTTSQTASTSGCCSNSGSDMQISDNCFSSYHIQTESETKKQVGRKRAERQHEQVLKTNESTSGSGSDGSRMQFSSPQAIDYRRSRKRKERGRQQQSNESSSGNGTSLSSSDSPQSSVSQQSHDGDSSSDISSSEDSKRHPACQSSPSDSGAGESKSDEASAN